MRAKDRQREANGGEVPRAAAEPATAAVLLLVLVSAALGRETDEPRRPGPIQSTGKPISAETALRAGDVVQAEWRGRWWAARVVEVRPDGRVKIHYVGWESKWDDIVPRSRLQIDPDAAARAKASAAASARQTPARIPPRVVAVHPLENATDVSPELGEISVTFDRPMTTERSWSWMILAPYGLYPGSRGGAGPRFNETGRTCVLSVSLVAGAVYAVGTNSPRHTGFKDADGLPALNFGWVFATGGYRPEEMPPRVVRTNPEHGATDVDPGLGTISVTFDRPMRRHTWSWVRQPERGEYPGAQEGSPGFDEDGLTCTLPVALKPETVYAVSVNSYRHTGFKSRSGAPALPFAWAFRTRQ